MKTRFLPGLLVALSMFVSCISELRDPELSKSEIVFTAMTEPQLDSRTSIEAGTQVYWEPDDEITVFSGSRSGRFVSRLSAPVATASFYGSMEGWSSAAEVLALYPESEDAVCSGGLITTTLPSRQYARAGSFAQGTNLAVARSTGRTLQFYNVGGGVRFTLAEEGIKKVVFESLGDEWLAGKVRVGFEDGRPKVLEVTEGSRYVTLIPPDGEAFETGKWYYIVAIPGALESGYKLKFYKDEVYAQRVSETAVTIKRSIYGSIENADAGLEYEPIPNLTEWTTDKTMRGVQYAENGGGEGGEGGEGETGEIVNMPPEALFVMDDLNDLLQSFDDQNWTITYNDGPALTEADIKVGDVLYSMPVGDIAPEGYILRVTGIRKDGDRVVYDVEPAGLADAFEQLETTIPLDEIPLTDDCFTFYDPFNQTDWDGLLQQSDVSYTIPTRSLSDVVNSIVSETNLDIELSTDRWKITKDDGEFTVEVVLADGDDDLKTTDDQLVLEFKAEYDFNAIHVSFKDFHLSGYGAPDFGGSASLKFNFGDCKVGADSLKAQQARKKRMREMEKKLVGKKFRFVKVDLPVPSGCKILVKPRVDGYLFFNFSVEGELSVSVGFEKAPMSFSFGNKEDDCAQTDEKNTYFHYKPRVYYDIFTESEVKLSAGIGVGLVFGLSKVLSKIAYKNTYPFFGAFWEISANADTKVSFGHTNYYSGDDKYTATVSAEVYLENHAYYEGDFRFTNNLFFQFKQDLIKVRYPETDNWKYEKTYEYTPKYPSASCVSPENGGLGNTGEVKLEWDVPVPTVGDAFQHYVGLVYDVYASTDKNAVEKLNPNALVASGLNEKQYLLNIGEGLKTWYWRIVIRNLLSCQFESPVFRFDTGYDGEIYLNTNLARYLKDNPETIPDLRILSDGRLLRTPSNLVALNAVKELQINDPSGNYRIVEISSLLSLLPNLETLNCGYNFIRTIDLSHNLRLKNLSCKGNQLTALDLTGLSLLESINCSGNSLIDNLDITGCPSLVTLSCAKCKINYLDLSNCQNIRDVYASENHLDSLDISRCPNLIRLDIYAQYKERLKLRLTQAQYDGFALFKRHVNTDLEFVGTNGVEILLSDITNHSATVKVTMLDRGSFTGVGLFYSILEGNPSNYSNPDYVADMFAKNKLSETFTLDNLRSDTGYYVRGYAFDASEMRYYLGNTIHFRTLEAEPGPRVSLEPERVDFGEVAIGTTASKDLTIKNIGDMDLVFEILPIENVPFDITLTAETTLAPGDSLVTTVAFTPTILGEENATFIIRSNDPRGDLGLSLFGIGTGETPPSPGMPAAIDMGLPSGTKWASYNIGATREEDTGNYFAWGETVTKDSFYLENYKFFIERWVFSKYQCHTEPIDNKSILEPEDDAAYVRFGGKWRMPSCAELEELMNPDNCEIAWDYRGEDGGYLIKSKKTGNSIFLPRPNIYTYYWTSSLGPYDDDAYALCFTNGGREVGILHSRCDNGLIRPVYGDPVTNVTRVELNENSLDLVAGDYRQLIPRIYPDNTATNKVIWSSSNDRVVVVDESGGVYAVSAGTAIITVKTVDRDKTATCVCHVTGVFPEEVDLGLSVKWAGYNVGASTIFDSGALYAWGEIETKEHYWWDSYKWCMGSSNSITKYNDQKDWGYNGFTDNKHVLDQEDDIAYVMNGENWTMGGLSSLNQDTHVTRISIGGVDGVIVRSSVQGYTDKWIFLRNGIYWFNTCRYPTVAWTGRVEYGRIESDENFKCSGFMVRPMRKVRVSSVSLDRSSLTIERGVTESINATVFPLDATDQAISWSSSDGSIVAVSRPGVFMESLSGDVTGRAPGSATITVTTRDGSKIAQCNVKVIVYIDELFLNSYYDDPLHLIIGEQKRISQYWYWYPEDATETDLIWKSDDPSIVSVDNGVVRGLKVGKTRISAIVKTEVKGHLEASIEIEVHSPDGGHEGFGSEYWD